MSSILHRVPGNKLPMATGGAGVWLQDAEGRRYLDASGGAAVSVLGHGHPRVIEAIKRQAENLAYAHTAFFANEPSEALAAFITERAPRGFGKVFFSSGGSEAVETALKLARQYHVARGDLTRTNFIARRQSYHGATLGALSVGGHTARRGPYEPLLAPCRFIPPCYAYRNLADGETLEEYGLRAANALEEEILQVGPDTVAAFIAEPVVGATLGAVPPAPGYLKRIREICDRYGVLFIADEVMCGMGRTGRLFAVDHDEVSPDIICVAKGLAGGYQPLGATVLSNRVYDAVTRDGGRFEHGHTYIGHAIACAAGLAVQQTISDDGLLDEVARKGPLLKRLLQDRLQPLGVVGDIRGRGFLIGVELVEDIATRRPFPASAKLNGLIKSAAMARGLIVYPGGGSVDGVNGDHILLAPPYIVSEQEMEEIVDRLASAIEACLPARVA
ncbi:MAG: aspartate aminotransferase family protein [Hyphomonadaceae bacterium]